MARTVRSGILITGDSSGAVQATQVTREELEKLKQKQGEVSGSSRSLGESVRGVGRELAEGAKKAALFGAAIGGAAAAALVQMTRAGLRNADALGKQSESLGIAAEQLAVLRVAGDRAGVSQGTLDRSIGRLTTTIGQAAEGIGTGVRALDRLGLSAEELRQKSPDEQMRILADAIRGVTNQTDRMTTATELFGQGAARDMLRVLNLGSAGMDEFARKAEVAGVTLDNVATTQVAAANDAMADLRMLTDGLGQQLAVQFSPLLQEAAERLFGVAEDAGGLGEVANRVFQVVMRGAGMAGDAILGLRLIWLNLQQAVSQVIQFHLRAIDRLVTTAQQAANLVRRITFRDEVEYERSGFAKFADALEADFQERSQTINQLLMGALPSEQLQDFVADVQRRSEQMARRVVADQQDMQRATRETEDAVDDLGEASEVAAQQMTHAWTDAAASLRRTLASAFEGGISSFSDFASRLKRGVTSMFADMARQSFANPILMNLGLVGGGGGLIAGAGMPGTAAGGGLGGLAGLAGMGSLLSGGMAGLSGMLTQGVVGVSNLLTNVGLGGVATQLQLGAANLSTLPGGLAGGLGLSAGAGIAGNMLAGALGLTGGHSGIGGTIGGIAGTLFGGPIGGGIGSFLGSAIGGLFGGGTKTGALGVHTGRPSSQQHVIDSITAASGLQLQAIARRVGDEGEQAAQQMLRSFAEIDAAMTQALRAAGIQVDLSGAQLSGISASSKHLTGTGFFGSNVEGVSQAMLESAPDDFVRAWLQEVNHLLPQRVRSLMSGGLNATAQELVSGLEQALSLDMLIGLDVVNETEAALRALGKEQDTLLEQYGRQVDRVLELAGEFDRSAGSLEALSSALREQKGLAAELALTYQLLGDEIDATFRSTIQSIRESLMGDEELFNFRREEIRRLTDELNQTLDPGKIARITEEIDRLSRAAFGQLDEGQQQALGDQFIDFLEQANQIAQRQLDAGLQQLQERETSLGQAIDFELSVQAANTQLLASEQFLAAVERFSALVESGRFSLGAFGFDLSSLEVNR